MWRRNPVVDEKREKQNGFMVLVKECILREERVWKGCMPDSSMISFAVLIVK